MLGHILHDWNLDEKWMSIRKAYDAVPEGGALIVYDSIIDDSRRNNAFGLTFTYRLRELADHYFTPNHHGIRPHQCARHGAKPQA